MAPKTLRLHVWGTTPTSLPTLDPISLYAASLLTATFAHDEQVSLQFASASTSLSRVPLLQVLNEQHENVEIIDNIDAILAFSVASGLDTAISTDAEKFAKLTALHALLDDQLLDITLHSLFSLPQNFRSVTAPAYSSVGCIDPSSSSNVFTKLATLPLRFQPSIPSRLRNLVETRLTAAGLWGLGGKEASAQSGESDDLAARAGIIPKAKKGLGDSAKETVRDEFERSKLVTRAREVLDVINAVLADGKFAYGGDKAGSIDVKIFAYLAPLVLASPKLPVDTIPKLIKNSYKDLDAYIERMQAELYPTKDSTIWISPAEVQSTPPLLTTASSSSSGSGLLSFFWPSTPTKASATNTATPAPASAHQPNQPRQSPTTASAPSPAAAKQSKTPEERKLSIGRALWICSALIGLVGYTFASGIVSVQFVDSDEADEGEGEDAEEPDKDEDDDGEEDEDDVDEGEDENDDAEDEEDEASWQVQTEEDLEDDFVDGVDFGGDDEEDEFE